MSPAPSPTLVLVPSTVGVNSPFRIEGGGFAQFVTLVIMVRTSDAVYGIAAHTDATGRFSTGFVSDDTPGQCQIEVCQSGRKRVLASATLEVLP